MLTQLSQVNVPLNANFMQTVQEISTVWMVVVLENQYARIVSQMSNVTKGNV